mgnify:FL=1
MTDDWDEVSYVISSQYRLAVVDELADEPATPTEIASEAEFATSHVSRAVGRLHDRSIVELTVPESQHVNRQYRLTEKGRRLWDNITEAELVG